MIDESVAQKVLDTIDAGLVWGLGNPVPGQMCVEAAVCHALGLPHGDDPKCVSPALRCLKINLNDSPWSSNQSRASGLRRLGVAQLGSRDTLDEKDFSERVVLMTIRTTLADCLDSIPALKQHAANCRAVTDLQSGAANAAAAWAADAAVNAAAAKAASAAAKAASAAAKAAAWAADADKVLSDFAERVVQILIDMDAPGTKWLYLTEEKTP